mmetsp:Transcript_96813/g.273838  ORF Transcript_96813/g.273838 Transcript_96813/m.273838 type:complete len:227 (+) Transcript_96813:34-714(+)
MQAGLLPFPLHRDECLGARATCCVLASHWQPLEFQDLLHSVVLGDCACSAKGLCQIFLPTLFQVVQVHRNRQSIHLPVVNSVAHFLQIPHSQLLKGGEGLDAHAGQRCTVRLRDRAKLLKVGVNLHVWALVRPPRRCAGHLARCQPEGVVVGKLVVAAAGRAAVPGILGAPGPVPVVLGILGGSPRDRRLLLGCRLGRLAEGAATADRIADAELLVRRGGRRPEPQ